MKKQLLHILLTMATLLLMTGQTQAQTCTAPAAPSISGATIAPCSTSNSFTLTASGPSSLITGWYPFPYGGNALNTGSTFVTPTYTSGATFYVGQTSSVSTGSISLPGHVSTFNGNTRGMWFTAPVSFIITGLRVPTDVSNGNQSIAVMKFASNPPTYATTTNSFNLLYLTQNNTNAGIIPVNIPINSGDVIGLLGCRANGSTYGTSYGSVGPFTASLGTSTLALNRLGMQYVLATTSPQDIWTEGASIGRVEVYTTIGCISSLTPVTVTVTPAPQVAVIGPTTSICSGASATLSATGASTYSWLNTSATSTSIVVNPSSTTVYSVSGAVSPTCASTATFNLVVNSGPPSLSVTASSNTVCLGGTVTLTGSGANTYTWSNAVANGASFSPSVTSVYTLTASNACASSSVTTSITVAPLPIATAASSTLNCAGNAATLTATGANTYTWLPINFSGSVFVVSPSANTTFSVVGALGNCLGTNTINLAVNPLPTVNLVASSTLVCQGDSVILTASGGLNYTWTPSNLSGSTVTVNPTAPIAYSVSGDNTFGCVSGAQQIVITNPSPTLSVSGPAGDVCAGDAVTLTVNGATTYTWSTGSNNTSIVANPLTTTVYAVSGTSSNCSSSQTISVSVFEPTLSISGQTMICSGESSILNASGAGSYTWSTGSNFPGTTVNPTVTTLYTVSAISTSASLSCPVSQSVLVTVNPTPAVTASASRTLMCKGETNTLTAGGANTFSWSTGVSSSSIVITPSLITTLNYTVTGFNSFGCKSNTVVNVMVSGCIGLEETEGKNALVVYPNPSRHAFTIKAEVETRAVLVDYLGREIKIIQLNQQNNFEQKVEGLSSGAYLLFMSSGSGTITRRVIVE